MIGWSLVADLDQHQARMRWQYGVEPGFGGVVATPPPEGVWLIYEDISVEIGEQANAVVGVVVLFVDVGHGYPVAVLNVGPEIISGCGVGRISMVVIEDKSVSRPKQVRPDHKEQGESAGDFEAGCCSSGLRPGNPDEGDKCGDEQSDVPPVDEDFAREESKEKHG